MSRIYNNIKDRTCHICGNTGDIRLFHTNFTIRKDVGMENHIYVKSVMTRLDILMQIVPKLNIPNIDVV